MAVPITKPKCSKDAWTDTREIVLGVEGKGLGDTDRIDGIEGDDGITSQELAKKFEKRRIRVKLVLDQERRKLDVDQRRPKVLDVDESGDKIGRKRPEIAKEGQKIRDRRVFVAGDRCQR
jgi:hypothetical protein